TYVPPPAPLTEQPLGEANEDLASVFRGGPVRTSKGGGWHIAGFIMPLISYAVPATIIAALYFFRYQALQGGPKQRHPLEFVPDLEGDNPTVGKKNAMREMPSPNQELPPQLRASLGQTLQVGDLEVEPLRVERGPIAIADTPGGDAEPVGE